MKVSVEALAQMAKKVLELEDRADRLESLEFASFTGGAGTWVEIATVTVSAPVATISFLAIPQVFLHLAAIFSLREDDAFAPSGGATLLCQVNGDSTEHYWYLVDRTWTQDGISCTRECYAAFPAKWIAWWVCSFPGPGYLEGNDPETFSAGHMWIPDYRNEYKKKTFIADNFWNWSEGESWEGYLPRRLYREKSGGVWHNLSPITQLDFFMPGPTNFAKNSKISLYGILGTFQQFP